MSSRSTVARLGFSARQTTVGPGMTHFSRFARSTGYSSYAHFRLFTRVISAVDTGRSNAREHSPEHPTGIDLSLTRVTQHIPGRDKLTLTRWPVTTSLQTRVTGKTQPSRTEYPVASRTIVALIDDLDGGDAEETVSFALDGIDYDIDLSANNAAGLRKVLAEFVESARRMSGRKNRGTPALVHTRVDAGGDKAQNQAIRNWARSQGFPVSDRGRIPADLVERFQDAHSA
jgi:hypothetical protein